MKLFKTSVNYMNATPLRGVLVNSYFSQRLSVQANDQLWSHCPVLLGRGS